MQRDAATGGWDGANARGLLEYAVRRDHDIFGLELLDELYPPSGLPRPVLIGPDPLHTPVIFRSVLHSDPEQLIFVRDFEGNASELGLELFALTHHEYIGVGCEEPLDPLCADTRPHGAIRPPQPSVLDRTATIVAAANGLHGTAGPRASAPWAVRW